MNRLDTELVERGLARSRSHAQKLIKSGCVFADKQTQPLTKPSLKVDADTLLSVTATEEDRYVSRGGLKLEGALQRTGIDLTGAVALDIGQSTGGFTDCLLQEGVVRVVGVDVGREQLSSALKKDPRVIGYEGINARALPSFLRQRHCPEGFDIAVMDVSFISQTLIYPSLMPQLRQGGIFWGWLNPSLKSAAKELVRVGLYAIPSFTSRFARK